MFRIEVSRVARRYLERLDTPTKQRIATAIDGLGRNPFEGDVRRLQGDPMLYRKRVGDFRILFRVDRPQRLIRVEAIRPRGEAYKP
ncbi:MAG: type II toxin-antitoxin system RelE/ParE family toxin [Candidatus Geothermarchaeales archaeon]